MEARFHSLAEVKRGLTELPLPDLGHDALCWLAVVLEAYGRVANTTSDGDSSARQYRHAVVLAVVALRGFATLHPLVAEQRPLETAWNMLEDDLRIAREEAQPAQVHLAALGGLIEAAGQLMLRRLQSTEVLSRPDNDATWASLLLHVAVEATNLAAVTD